MAPSEETKAAAPERSRTVFAVRLSWRGKDWEIVVSTSDRVPLQEALLPQTRPLWKFFSAGAFVQIMLLLAALSVPLLFPDRVKDFRNYVATAITPPPDVVRASKPQPLRPRKILAIEVPPRPSLLLALPAIPPPVVTTPAIKPIKAIITADAPSIPAEPPATVALNTVTIPNLQKPRGGVQTGGFGDPNGLHDSARTTRTPNVAQLGRFNLPPGTAGLGNGTVMSQASGPSGVQQGLFADAHFAEAARKSSKDAETSSLAKPVEIVFKPRPTYTSFALSKKIEGEVLLEVRFPASGEATVLRVVRGLGYGLDDAAEAAARQIQFRPAQNDDGLPVDSTAVVHIVFELAY
jgi:TonB family protein